MLTVNCERLDIQPGMRLLDLGCGNGRHSFEAFRRGAQVTAADLDEAGLRRTAEMVAAMDLAGEREHTSGFEAVIADARQLPFDDEAFDRVIVSEVLEHIHDDRAALGEVARVVRPGGRVAFTVPRWWPEQICWALSDDYHAKPGSHVRIYRESDLRARIRAAGLEITGKGYAHSLHAPYWWLKCAVGVDREPFAVRAYHWCLVWDLVHRPAWLRRAEQAVDPILGKSLVLYAKKPSGEAAAA